MGALRTPASWVLSTRWLAPSIFPAGTATLCPSTDGSPVAAASARMTGHASYSTNPATLYSQCRHDALRKLLLGSCSVLEPRPCSSVPLALLPLLAWCSLGPCIHRLCTPRVPKQACFLFRITWLSLRTGV